MTDKETMQLALDALDLRTCWQTYLTTECAEDTVNEAMEALKKALARPGRKPLTTLFKLALYNLEADNVLELESYLRGIKDAEAAHGIKETE
jgi:hypothetical protein